MYACMLLAYRKKKDGAENYQLALMARKFNSNDGGKSTVLRSNPHLSQILVVLSQGLTNKVFRMPIEMQSLAYTVAVVC